RHAHILPLPTRRSSDLTRLGGFVVTHGRSGDMRNRLVTRVARAAADAGLLALRMNFWYVEEGTMASKDLSREEGDLRGAIQFLRDRKSTRLNSSHVSSS